MLEIDIEKENRQCLPHTASIWKKQEKTTGGNV